MKVVWDDRTKLKNIGCTDIRPYTLVNNYGYRFSKGGVGYDLRYWENCYGVYGGGWRVDPDNRGFQGSPHFGADFDAAIEWIKNNL